MLPINDNSIYEDTDDINNLPQLDSDNVIKLLNTRYTKNLIYTFAGPLIIAINPYKKVEMSTHLSKMTQECYQTMLSGKKNQSILISGESGSGKTETTKILLKYLIETHSDSKLERKLLASNPILEMFGNAKTIRNDNSSRFGKYLNLRYNEYGVLQGASIKTYLLERSRIVNIPKGENNYHIFYLLNLKEKFRYLGDSPAPKIFTLDDINESLKSIGLVEQEITEIYNLLLTILKLGNITFTSDEKDNLIMYNKYQEIAPDLGITNENLIKLLTEKEITAGKNKVLTKLSVQQAETSRDSLAVWLYENLFNYLVTKINISLGNDSVLTNDAVSNESLDDEFYYIGILDIFGFESFENNSFEQFCINYTNEKLQTQFYNYMFITEQKEFENEGLKIPANVEYPDNRLCLQLIENNMGIIDLLNEETKFPKGSGETFLQKISSNCVRNPHFEKKGVGFCIKHYADKVMYNPELFLQKNSNALVPLLDTTNNLISKFEGFKKDYLIVQFKQDLIELNNKINGTDPHYIRCIKPNDVKKPLRIVIDKIKEQLKCGGVLEAVRASQAGYPTKVPIKLFEERYKNLFTVGDIIKKYSNKICKGNTKLFMKSEVLSDIEKLRDTIITNSVISFQKYIRSYNSQKQYQVEKRLQLEKASLIIQRTVRKYIVLKDFNNLIKRTKEPKTKGETKEIKGETKEGALGLRSPHEIIDNLPQRKRSNTLIDPPPNFINKNQEDFKTKTRNRNVTIGTRPELPGKSDQKIKQLEEKNAKLEQELNDITNKKNKELEDKLKTVEDRLKMIENEYNKLKENYVKRDYEFKVKVEQLKTVVLDKEGTFKKEIADKNEQLDYLNTELEISSKNQIDNERMNKENLNKIQYLLQSVTAKEIQYEEGIKNIELKYKEALKEKELHYMEIIQKKELQYKDEICKKGIAINQIKNESREQLSKKQHEIDAVNKGISELKSRLSIQEDTHNKSITSKDELYKDTLKKLNKMELLLKDAVDNKEIVSKDKDYTVELNLNDANKRNDILNAELINLHKEVAQFKAILEDKETIIEDLKMKNKSREERVHILSEELEHKEVIIDGYLVKDLQIKELSVESAEKDKELQALNTDLHQQKKVFNEILEKYEEDLDILSKEREDLIMKLVQGEDLLNTKDETVIVKLNDELNQYKDQCLVLENKYSLAQTQRKSEQVDKEENDKQIRINELLDKMSDYDKELKLLQNEVKTVKEDYVDLQANYDYVKTEWELLYKVPENEINGYLNKMKNGSRGTREVIDEKEIRETDENYLRKMLDKYKEEMKVQPEIIKYIKDIDNVDDLIAFINAMSVVHVLSSLPTAKQSTLRQLSKNGLLTKIGKLAKSINSKFIALIIDQIQIVVPEFPLVRDIIDSYINKLKDYRIDKSYINDILNEVSLHVDIIIYEYLVNMKLSFTLATEIRSALNEITNVTKCELPKMSQLLGLLLTDKNTIISQREHFDLIPTEDLINIISLYNPHKDEKINKVKIMQELRMNKSK